MSWSSFKETLKPCISSSSSSSSHFHSSTSEVDPPFQRKPPKSSLSQQLQRLQEDPPPHLHTLLPNSQEQKEKDHQIDHGDDDYGDDDEDDGHPIVPINSERAFAPSGFHPDPKGPYEPLILSADGETPVIQGDETQMEIDIATSVTQGPAKHSLPELEIYCYLIVLIFLIDQKRYNEAKDCSSASITRVKNLNRRTVDVLASRLFFYYSYSYELTDSLAEIRGNLLALHRLATLRHDELGQETLLNLLLRNYLHYNLYDQAEKLRSKAPRFEAHSNQQFCRYLFYLGKIRTIQLEYTDAKESLLQAARKAPIGAQGFRIQCNKWAVIVRLLLGEIPERIVFMQKGMKKALRPYFELTNAVRIGDLELFRTVAEKFSDTFNVDRTHNLIVRLRHNVIRTGLRNISISYSRISLADVAKKLRMDSANPVADAESIVAKAIRDGAIDATLDHTNGWMVSKEMGDVYSTNEPQIAFNSRIAFCLNMHNEAVKALRFPPNSHKKEESAEKRRERQQQEQELAKHIAEEDDDEF